MSYLPALAVKHPKMGDAFLGGKRFAQQQEMNALGMETRKLQNEGLELNNALNQMKTVATGTFGVMRGDLKNPVDPTEYEQMLDMFEQNGMKVDAYRNKPELARMMAQGSKELIGLTLQAQRNQISKDRLNLSFQKFQKELDEAAKPKFTKPVQAMKDGKPVWVQSSDTGENKVMDGFTPLNPTKTINTATEQIVINSRTGEEISRTPIQNREKARQGEIGKIEGKSYAEAQKDLPQVTANTNEMLSVIDGLMDHPGMDSSLGVIDGALPAIMSMPGNAQNVANFRSRLAQLEGKTFLQAYQSLRGGGQITEVEGKKATDAIARLSQTQDPKEFKIALNELRQIVINAQSRAEKLAQPPVIFEEIVEPDKTQQQTPPNQNDPLGLND